MDAQGQTKVYVCDTSLVRVGKPIMGWEAHPNGNFVITSSVETIEQTSAGLLATTELGSQYLVVNRK